MDGAVKQPRLDQSSAIMISIKHCGDVLPGQKCSAIYFGKEDIEREKAFYVRFCKGNGIQDPLQIEMMVSAHVPSEPYWLVSFKPSDNSADSKPDSVRFHKVDDRTGQVVPDPV